MTTLTTKKIAINTRVLMPNKLDGIGWFTYQVVKRWVEKNPDVEFYFIFDRPYDSSFIFGKNVTPIVLSPPARHPILWYLWFEWMIPRLLNRLNPDVFVSLDTYTTTRWKGKKITGIHDIAFALFDGQVSWLTEKFFRHYIPQYISVSEKIVTVSNSSKHDLINFYHCPENKIVVSNNAASDAYLPMSEDAIKQFKSENTNNCDYFIFVGSIHPRKNVVRMLQAFEKYKTHTQANTKFVLIGRNWNYKDVKDYLLQMKYRNDVIEIPHSSPEIIAKWIGASIALVLVSIYEGFGVPIVEALACGVPVICSNVSSMPEVAGQAAILVNPNVTEEIANAMTKIVSNKELYRTLTLNTSAQSVRYNWNDAADIIWKCI